MVLQLDATPDVAVTQVRPDLPSAQHAVYERAVSGILLITRLLPSMVVIDGLVRVAQVGAPLSDVAEPFLTLWALAGLYSAIAVALAVRR